MKTDIRFDYSSKNDYYKHEIYLNGHNLLIEDGSFNKAIDKSIQMDDDIITLNIILSPLNRNKYHSNMIIKIFERLIEALILFISSAFSTVSIYNLNPWRFKLEYKIKKLRNKSLDLKVNIFRSPDDFYNQSINIGTNDDYIIIDEKYNWILLIIILIISL